MSPCGGGRKTKPGTRRLFFRGDRTGHGRRLIFDIESNDLFPGLTAFWCTAAVDIDTGEAFYWGVDLSAGSLADCIEFRGQALLLLAHNGTGYDYRAIEELHPGWCHPAKSRDTQVIAKVV